MPHFENIEQYESLDPKSGRRRIVPIAPHSMQAADYRPRHREQARKRLKEETNPSFPEVEVSPISISQMEKEFRQAAKADEKRKRARRPKGWRPRLRRLLKALRLLPKSKPQQSPDSPKKTGRQKQSAPDRKAKGSPARKNAAGRESGPSSRRPPGKRGPSNNRGRGPKNNAGGPNKKGRPPRKRDQNTQQNTPRNKEEPAKGQRNRPAKRDSAQPSDATEAKPSAKADTSHSPKKQGNKPNRQRRGRKPKPPSKSDGPPPRSASDYS